MKILLTGGAGYIGSVTANIFLDRGHQVHIVDDLSTGSSKNLPKKAKFTKCNISDKRKISNILRSNKFDVLLHFAAFIDVEESVKYPKKYLQNNYKNTIKLFQVCKDFELKNIIFSSTAAVYGNSKTGHCGEKSDLKPTSMYAKSKLKVENYLKKQKKLSYIILRYFNVAGADLNLRSGLISKNKSTHLIKKLCESFLNKKKIIINGKDYPTKDGTPVRDYIHVVDLAIAHYNASKYIIKEGKSNIFNCGYGKGFSVLEIVNEFNKINKRKVEIIFGNRRKGDITSLVSKEKKIKKTLKWKPKYNSINKILKSSLKWERKINKSNAKKY